MFGKAVWVLGWAVLLAACGGGGGQGGGGPRDTVLIGARETADGNKFLWRTDGTASGTERVRAGLLSMPSASRFPSVVGMNGRYYFRASEAYTSLLWVTDGTEAGTQPVESALYAGPTHPEALTVLDNLLYFTASGGVGQRDLWRTDGTPEGTWRIDDLVAPGVSPRPSSLTVLDEQLFMVVSPGLNQRALIRYNTVDGTVTLLRNVDREGFAQLVQYNGRLVFAEHVDDISHLWSMDPETGEAGLLLELPMSSSLRAITGLKVVGGQLYFLGTDAEHGEELWVSDGTAEGTRLHTDMSPGPESSRFSQLHVSANTLLIPAASGSGDGLWAVDSANTAPRRLLDSPHEDIRNHILGTYEHSLYFHRHQNDQLCAVAISTAALRCLEEPVAPVPTYSLLFLNGDLLFVGQREGLGKELWRTRPALSNAEMIMDICPGDCSAF